MSFIHFDQSTFLAARAQWASEMGEQGPPDQIALPGAKGPIKRDRLEAHQENGRSELEIVAKVNAAWRQEAGERLWEHDVWRNGTYTDGIELARQIAAEEAADRQRRRAEIAARLRGGG